MEAEAGALMDRTNTPTVMVVYGTRPEGIKVAPVILALREDPRLEVISVTTGQHPQMLDEVNEQFGIVPDVRLWLFDQGQPLNILASKIFAGLDAVLVEHAPDALLVQGDTTTVAMAALAAFNRRIPVVHLEAGLRSGDIASPFPEEGNRRITSQVAALHLAPTAEARDNLLREGIDPATVVVTGNTVIDALELIIARASSGSGERVDAALESGGRIVTVTAHRRENWGEPLQRIARTVRDLALAHPEIVFVLPLHANPLVGRTFAEYVDGVDNVITTSPMPYPEFLTLVRASSVVLSDSGGVQEEAPSLGTPLLILRETTERPEAVESGWAQLVGTDHDRIIDTFEHLLGADAAARAARSNPFGDGAAAQRTVGALAELLGVGERLEDFRGGADE